MATRLYGHGSSLQSIRLAHPGCAISGCGYVRLLAWDRPRDPGLGDARPLDVGSRWMGQYTRDILLVRDAYVDAAENENQPWTLSPVVRAALDPSGPVPGFFSRFVGLRELFVLGPNVRHAFIQRSGFERPGFGHFFESTPLPVTEGTHGNVVQASGEFSTKFYRELFGLLSLGGPQRSGWQRRSTADVLMLEEGQTFEIERLGSPGKANGFLHLYAPDRDAPDRRPLSSAGSLGLCQYSYLVTDIAEVRSRATAAGASKITPILSNEFGEPSCSLVAPDGISWTLIATS